MHLIPKRSTFALMARVLGIALTVGIGQEAISAQGPAVGKEPKVEEAFKNIKSLTGLPADMLIPTMVFFEASLGVGCEFCHDPDVNKRELDVREQKPTARRMIAMVNAINETTFKDTREVTCFTCHQGRSTPIGIPNVTNSELPRALGQDYIANLPPPPPVPAITAGEVLDKYIAALGGANALQRVPSLTAVGTVVQHRPGRDVPANQIEISSKAPGMGLTATRAGQNENLLAYGANDGWAKAGTAAPRDLRKAEADGTRLEDPFNLPVQLKQMLLEPQMDHPEVIGSRELYVITGHTQHLPMVKGYFEKESGMLARLVYYTDTPFGRYPTQIEYGDFRDVGGRKVPYRWVISQTRNREFTYAMQAVRATAVDDSKFAKPAASSR